MQSDAFCEYIENLSLCQDKLECFDFLRSNQFKSLKRIEFRDISFTAEKIASIQHILTKGATQRCAVIEDMHFVCCTIEGEFFTDVLQYCTQIKRITLLPYGLPDSDSEDDVEIDETCFPLIGVNNEWMLHSYPTLEYIALGDISGYYPRIDELRAFFERNQNVQKFAVDVSYFSVQNVADMGLQVENFAILCANDNPGVWNDMFAALHQNKFYKRLQFYDPEQRPIHIDGLNALQNINELEKFCTRRKVYSFPSLLCLKNLKTLRIKDLGSPEYDENDENNLLYEVEELCQLTQLETVSIEKASSAELTALIGRLPNLKTLMATEMKDSNVSISLFNCNKKRELLYRPRKVRVYLPEAIYLAVKSATNETNHALVQLKRIDSYQWEDDFSYIPQTIY